MRCRSALARGEPAENGRHREKCTHRFDAQRGSQTALLRARQSVREWSKTADPIVDDDPLPIRQWLPRFAQWLKAPPAPPASEEAAREIAGEDAAYYSTKLRGASNRECEATARLRAAPYGIDD